MYTIYADDKLLYATSLYDKNYTVFDPVINYELNRAATCTFTIPKNNPNYNAITKLKTEIKVFDDARRIFRGRVLYDDVDFYLQKTVYAEDETAYLNDAVVRPYEYTGSVANYMRKLIHAYNSAVTQGKRFGRYNGEFAEANLIFGNCTVTDPNNYITRANSGYPTVLSEISEKLIGILGGFLMPRYDAANDINYIDYLADSGGVGAQTIRFAENLLDLATNVNAEDVFTVIVPLGARIETEGETDERLTIEHVKGKKPDPDEEWGTDYIENATGIAKYGRIERVVEWDDVTVDTNLWNKAKTMVDTANEETHTVECKAVDLSKAGVNVQALKLGQWNHIVSLPHGYTRNTDNLLQLAKMNLKLQAPENSEYSFTKEYRAKDYQTSSRGAVATEKSVSVVAGAADDAKNAAAAIDDYIKERGSSGNWKWEKWNSGKLVLWGYYISFSITTWNNYVTIQGTTILSSGEGTITLPISFSDDKYDANVNLSRPASGGGAGNIMCVRHSAVNKIGIAVMTGTAYTRSNFTADVHIVGTWE